jgi:hypothetical protein
MPLVGIDPARAGANEDVDLRRMAAHALPVTARINVWRYLDAKERAIACHASQIPAGGRPSMRLASRLGRLLQSVETFHRALPAVSTSERIERDLFEGVT